MKKTYEAPRAEKLEFDYTETIAASGGCYYGQQYKDGYRGCHETPTDKWVYINDTSL